MGLRNWLIEKLNPAQGAIAQDQGGTLGTDGVTISVLKAYNDMPVVSRGVNMLVDAAASFSYDVLEKLSIEGNAPGLRQKRLHNVLNFQPNPYQDVSRFRRSVFMDLILEGNVFIYWDGVHMYHLPAANMQVETDNRTFVKKYTYNAITEFAPTEIIHIMDNSSQSIFIGDSRMSSIIDTVETRKTMTNFQKLFFTNNTVMGVVLESDNVLGDKLKNRMIENWLREYNPSRGGKRPIILDGGLKLKKTTDTTFQQLDFSDGVKEKDTQVLLALGIPPILLEGGNNANIAPNLRLFYLETVMPMVQKLCSALELFFGYDIQPEAGKVSALQPDLKASSAYYSTLVNAGIITPNEARRELRWEKSTDPSADKLRVPQNITGSASNPSQGGRPTDDDEGD